MSNAKVVELGDRVRDMVTGFEGIAMGRNEWVNKCTRFAVQNEKLKDGKPIDAVWFDVEQLEVVKKGIVRVHKEVPIAARPNGPWTPSGGRRSDPAR